MDPVDRNEASGAAAATMGLDGGTPGEPEPRPGATGSGGASNEFVSLYRRFRPGRFGELRGQPHVVRALQSAVREDVVGHAYLFSGPRGTGKTSAARILARALNCDRPLDGEPCGRCASCIDIARGASFDVHELDAASNNGVDAMRDLVAHAALGTPGRWKVYIVDEVHMLSNAAANALLKTLEEPPGHVVFVLATTDPQKVPATIKSRTQQFEFRLLGSEVLEELLRDVRHQAGLDVDDETLAAAVRRARGSARDALTSLDQAVVAGGVDERRPTVAKVTGVLDDEDPSALLVAVAELHEAGWSSQQLAEELVDELRQAFLLALAPGIADVAGSDRQRLSVTARTLGLAKLVRGMELLGRAGVEMREAPDPRVVLEVALVRLVRPDLDDTTEALLERVARLERAVTASAPRLPAPPATPVPATPTAVPTGPAATAPSAGRPASPDAGAHRARASRHGEVAEEPASGTAAGRPAEGAVDRDALVEAWGDHILRSLPPRAKALYSAGRFVAVTDGEAFFALPKAAHRDRCEEIRPVVQEALERYFNAPVPLRLIVEGTDTPAGSDRARAMSPPVGSPAPMGTPGAVGRPEPDHDPGELDDYSVGDGQEDVESIAQARLLDAFPGAQLEPSPPEAR